MECGCGCGGVDVICAEGKIRILREGDVFGVAFEAGFFEADDAEVAVIDGFFAGFVDDVDHGARLLVLRMGAEEFEGLEGGGVVGRGAREGVAGRVDGVDARGIVFSGGELHVVPGGDWHGRGLRGELRCWSGVDLSEEEVGGEFGGFDVGLAGELLHALPGDGECAGDDDEDGEPKEELAFGSEGDGDAAFFLRHGGIVQRRGGAREVYIKPAMVSPDVAAPRTVASVLKQRRNAACTNSIIISRWKPHSGDTIAGFIA